MREHDDVQRLLRLKKYETPGEDYFEHFLGDFHERQRTDILRKSSRSLFLERLSTWFSGFGREKWILAGGLSYAVLMLTLYLNPDEPEDEPIRHASDPVRRIGHALLAIDYEESTASQSQPKPSSDPLKPAPRQAAVSGSPFLSLDELKLPLDPERGSIKEF